MIVGQPAGMVDVEHPADVVYGAPPGSSWFCRRCASNSPSDSCNSGLSRPVRGGGSARGQRGCKKKGVFLRVVSEFNPLARSTLRDGGQKPRMITSNPVSSEREQGERVFNIDPRCNRRDRLPLREPPVDFPSYSIKVDQNCRTEEGSYEPEWVTYRSKWLT